MDWEEVTEERYDEMLGILPPVAWIDKGFLVGEPMDHNEYGQPRFMPFVHYNGKFYEGSEPLTRAEWRALDPRPDIDRQNMIHAAAIAPETFGDDELEHWTAANPQRKT